MDNMERFVIQLKKQLMQEFEAQDRKGIYAFTQKSMAYNSNKIEGSTLTSEQTASLFDTGTILAADADFVFRTKDVEEMQGHFKMFNEVLKNLDCPLSADLIKRFHYQLKIGVFEDYANGYPVGEFKNRTNVVSDITTELPQNIPARIDDLVTRYNSSGQTLLDIAKFHAEYEKIHPFQDGNGRTGRAIILKQCLDSNLVPAIISDNDKLSYYHALHAAQVDNDFGKLVAFLEEAQDKYYSQAKDFIVLPKEKDIERSKLMKGFVERLKSQGINTWKADNTIGVCDKPDAVRCYVKNSSMMVGMDFSSGVMAISYNLELVSPQQLKQRDADAYKLYKDIRKTLKMYMREHNSDIFSEHFKTLDDKEPPLDNNTTKKV